MVSIVCNQYSIGLQIVSNLQNNKFQKDLTKNITMKTINNAKT